MTKSKIIRGFRLASIIMSAFLLIAVLCLHFIPLRIQSGGFTQSNTNSTDILRSRRTVFERAEMLGLEYDIPGVEPGQYAEFTAPERIYLAAANQDNDVIYEQGETAVMSFVSFSSRMGILHSLDPYGERIVSIGESSSESSLYLDENVLARCYIAYLEQTGQIELFEQETGLDLNEKNAVAILTAADEQAYEQGIYIPTTYPGYMRTSRLLRNISLWLMGISMALMVTMLIICHFVDTSGWTEANTERWQDTSAARSDFRMSSLSKSSEREPPPDNNKNKTRQELFKDF